METEIMLAKHIVDRVTAARGNVVVIRTNILPSPSARSRIAYILSLLASRGVVIKISEGKYLIPKESPLWEWAKQRDIVSIIRYIMAVYEGFI